MHIKQMKDGDKLADSRVPIVTNGTATNPAEEKYDVAPGNSTSNQFLVTPIVESAMNSVANSLTSGNCSTSTTSGKFDISSILTMPSNAIINDCSRSTSYSPVVPMRPQIYASPSSTTYQGMPLMTQSIMFATPPPAAHHNYCRSNLPIGSYHNTSSTVSSLTVPSSWQVRYSSCQQSCSVLKSDDSSFSPVVNSNKRENEGAFNASDNSASKIEDINHQISVQLRALTALTALTNTQANASHDSVIPKNKKMKVPATANTSMNLTSGIERLPPRQLSLQFSQQQQSLQPSTQQYLQSFQQQYLQSSQQQSLQSSQQQSLQSSQQQFLHSSQQQSLQSSQHQSLQSSQHQSLQSSQQQSLQPSTQQSLQSSQQQSMQPSYQQSMQPSQQQSMQSSQQQSLQSFQQQSLQSSQQQSLQPPIQQSLQPPIQQSLQPPIQQSLKPSQLHTFQQLSQNLYQHSSQLYLQPPTLQSSINFGILGSVLMGMNASPTNVPMSGSEIGKFIFGDGAVSSSSYPSDIGLSSRAYAINSSHSTVLIGGTSGLDIYSTLNLDLSNTDLSCTPRSDGNSSTSSDKSTISHTEVDVQVDSEDSNSSIIYSNCSDESELNRSPLILDRRSSSGSDESCSQSSDQNISFPSELNDYSKDDAAMMKEDSSFWKVKALIKETIEGICTPKLVQSGIKSVRQELPAEEETDDCVIVHAEVKEKSEDVNDVIICCTKWAHNYSGDVVKPKICYESVVGYCKFEDSGCPKLHANQHFHWQVKNEDNLWLNLRPEQVIALEKSYCDPNIDEVEVPMLDPSTLDKSFKGLLKLLKGRRRWKAIFDSMKFVGLQDLSDNLPIRRLCTEAVIDATETTSEEIPVYDWQVKGKRKQWVYLHSEQSSILEKAHHDVVRDGIKIPTIDQSMTTLNKFMNGHLTYLLGHKSWTANLDQMVLVDEQNTTTLTLRRYWTEIAAKGSTPDECLYSWYFKDKRNKWVEYGCMDSTRDPQLQCKIGSEAIEKHYQESKHTSMSIDNDMFNYSLDLINMVQTNLSTNVKRPMKRRPKSHLKFDGEIDKNTDDFMIIWDVMLPHERALRVKLSHNSEEFQKVANLFNACWQSPSPFQPLIIDIERVQNLFLWKAFKNKVQDLEFIYNDKDMVNIQLLFHGTKGDYLDNICQENFDWRLHGSNVGHAYGKGTYFSPFSSTSYAYCAPRFTYSRNTLFFPQNNANDKKYMFVAEVAVGQCVVGNAIMVRPPQNPNSVSLYDSTVDHMPNPKIVVKYDKQEYYPKYILTVS